MPRRWAAAASIVVATVAALAVLVAVGRPRVTGWASLEGYAYAASGAPDDHGTFTYTTSMAPAEQTFTYNTAVEPAAQTYTYTTGLAPAQDTYTYTTAMDSAPAEFTYTTSGGDAGMSSFTAQELSPQMTTIDGYVRDDATKKEAFWNVPIGEIHPLDTAGRWDLGQFASINPDSTARANAPLTLTGERADGTPASGDSTRPAPEDRLHAGTTQLLQTPPAAPSPRAAAAARRTPSRAEHANDDARVFDAAVVAQKGHISQACRVAVTTCVSAMRTKRRVKA